MVDEDEFERDDRGGAFLMGLLAGTALAAGLGVLFTARDRQPPSPRASAPPFRGGPTTEAPRIITE